MQLMDAAFHFHGDLSHLLHRQWRDINLIVQPVTRSASIKDVIESFGLPHTEVERIECDGSEVDFSCRVEARQNYDIHPVSPPWDVTRPSLLRPFALNSIAFIVDVNVGRLGRYLRMAGFDTLYDHRWDDEEILRRIVGDNRIVLTRDLGLLKRKQVQFGRCIRADRPGEQLREIIQLLALEEQVRPFIRCLECNALLNPVAKEAIVERLEPLTKKYYQTFSRCPLCDKIYWAGSHVDEMKKFFPEIYGHTA